MAIKKNITIKDRELKGIKILGKKFDTEKKESKVLFKFGELYFVRSYKGLPRLANLDGEMKFKLSVNARKIFNEKF